MNLPSWVPLRTTVDGLWERVWPLEFASDVDPQSVEKILELLQTNSFRLAIELTDRQHASLRVVTTDNGDRDEYVYRLYHLFWKLHCATEIKTINGAQLDAWAPRKIVVWPATGAVPGGFERRWGVKFAREVSTAEVAAAASKLSAGFRVTLEKTGETTALLRAVTDQQEWTDAYAICAIELVMGLEGAVAPLTWGGAGPS